MCVLLLFIMLMSLFNNNKSSYYYSYYYLLLLLHFSNSEDALDVNQDQLGLPHKTSYTASSNFHRFDDKIFIQS